MRLTFIFLSFLNSFTSYCQEPDLSNEYGSGNQGGALSFYQNYISPVRGGQLCPMYPSCSQYAKLGFGQLNPIAAYLKTTDRLLRCGHDLAGYERIKIQKTNFYYDPLISFTSVPDYTPIKLLIDISSFAQKLLNAGEYHLALLEFKRLLFLNEGDSDVVKYKIAFCHYHLENYPEVKDAYYEMVLEGIENDSIFNEMSLLVARAFIKENQYTKASQVLKTLQMSNNGPANLLMGECLMRQGKFGQASSYFMQSDRLKNDADQMGMALKLEDDYSALKMKKPWLAGTMSAVVPGLGYAYVGKKGTGLASLIINSLFIWTAAEAYQNKSYALFTTTSLLGLGWYIGNIKGSAEAAQKYNIDKKNEFINLTLDTIYH